MLEELLKTVLILSVGLGITLSTLLLCRRKGVLVANKLLACFICLMVIPLWNEYLSFPPAELSLLVIHPTFFYFPVLYGPLLYLYIVYFTRNTVHSKYMWAGIATGTGLAAIFKVTHFYILNEGFSQPIWFAFFCAIYTQLTFFLVKAWQQIGIYHNDLKQNHSSVGKLKLTWLRGLIIAYACLVVIDIIKLVVKVNGFDVLPFFKLAVSISECMFIFLIGYWGLIKPEIHFEDTLVKASEKYLNSSLKVSDAENLICKLKLAMKQEKLYRIQDMNLSGLASHLNVSPHYLSQAINEQLRQNFYEYINVQRVDYAKKLLSDDSHKHLTILEVAFKVGFNNKTSFNNAFKKHTHYTPSQFRTEMTS